MHRWKATLLSVDSILIWFRSCIVFICVLSSCRSGSRYWSYSWFIWRVKKQNRLLRFQQCCRQTAFSGLIETFPKREKPNIILRLLHFSSSFSSTLWNWLRRNWHLNGLCLFKIASEILMNSHFSFGTDLAGLLVVLVGWHFRFDLRICCC